MRVIVLIFSETEPNFFFFLSSSYEFLIDSLDWVSLFWQQKSLEGDRFVSIFILSVYVWNGWLWSSVDFRLAALGALSCGAPWFEGRSEGGVFLFFTQAIQACGGGGLWGLYGAPVQIYMRGCSQHQDVSACSKWLGCISALPIWAA